MNNSQPDITKMAIAAAVTACICIAVDNWPFRPEPFVSNRISWDEAETLKTYYSDNDPIMTQYTDAAGTATTGPLLGFKIDAKQVNEIINNNQNGVIGKTADELMIYFGAERDATTGLKEYKIILAGIQHLERDGVQYNVLLKNSNGRDNVKSSIFDRADPCPPNMITINN